MSQPERGRDRQQPFLVRIAGARRPRGDLRRDGDGAIFYLPRAVVTGVELLDEGELTFSDVGLPAPGASPGA